MKRFGGVLAATAVAIGLLAGPAAAADGGLKAAGSVEQVQVTGAEPGQLVSLVRKGEEVDTDRAGSLGGALFRQVEPRKGYSVEQGAEQAGPVRVLSQRSAPPSTALYDQHLPAGGYGYMATRDGTKLALTVHLPGPAADGPYPTLVEYSGYGTANPDGPESGIQPVANLFGYAVVDVNMRGMGCSGGAFDYFEPLQGLDGYDIIETVARQPWVLDNKVGMLGISYGGISQLFVAATRPPSLEAITPLSVVDNSATTLYPGGILNTGFALQWAQDRLDDAQVSGPDSGQAWAWKQIQSGDEVCKENQTLHTEAANLIAKTRRNSFYRPKSADPLSPNKFVDKINVPTFMACQWTDEQTGGHCPTLAAAMTGTDKKWFTFTNGVHTDSLDPETFNKWFDFLEIYVAHRKPELPPGVKAAGPVLYSAVLGVDDVQIPDDPIQAEPDLASAQAAFEAQKPVRILFDNGAGDAPGKPVPGFERSFNAFPPRFDARSWYLGGNGKLGSHPGGKGADQFTWDPDARPPTNFSGNTGSGDLWTDHPNYQWSQPAAGNALSYRTKPLAEDTTVLGAGEVQLWVRSEAENVDLQATVTEIRPDGKESFVQSGWLRTGARKVDRKQSRITEPVPTLRKRDDKALPDGRFAKVRVPLYYEGHVYRAGSRIRVTISAPGGDQPVWSFAETKPDTTPWVAIAHDKKHPSRLILPVTPGVEAPTPLPPCPGLRGEPCRTYTPFVNETFQP